MTVIKILKYFCWLTIPPAQPLRALHLLPIHTEEPPLPTQTWLPFPLVSVHATQPPFLLTAIGSPRAAVGGYHPGAPLHPPPAGSAARPWWGPCASPLSSMSWLGPWWERWQPEGGPPPAEGPVAAQLAQQPREGGKRDRSPR